MKNTLRLLGLQLFLTEFFSLLFFGWWLGLIAPVALLALPYYALLEKNHPEFWPSCLWDALFFLVLIFCMKKNRPVLASLALLAFNIAGLVLTLASW